MALVQRANKILEVKEDLVQRYLDDGYSQIDEVTGEVIASPNPTDVATLRAFYVEHTTKIKDLESEIASLKAELAKKQRNVKKSADTE